MKLALFIGFWAIGTLFMPVQEADAAGPCSVLDANPTVSGAERLIISLAEGAITSGEDTEQAGERFAKNIMQNCPEYVNIVLQAAENLGG